VLRLDWNALQAGDRVLVHHADGGAARLVAGIVVSVEQSGGSNDVGVRLASRESPAGLVHPGRLTVHHDPIELDSHCWRCTTSDPPKAGLRRA